MALQSSDLLLVQRGTVSYQMPASQLKESPEVAQTLQIVTDSGNHTTNNMTIGADSNSPSVTLGPSGITTVNASGFAFMTPDANIGLAVNSSTSPVFQVDFSGNLQVGGLIGNSPEHELNASGSALFAGGDVVIDTNGQTSFGGVSTIRFTNSTSGSINYLGNGTGSLVIHDEQDDSSRAVFKRNLIDFNQTTAEGGDYYARFETKGKTTLTGEAKIQLQPDSGYAYLSTNTGSTDVNLGLYVGVNSLTDEPKDFLFTNDGRLLIGDNPPGDYSIVLAGSDGSADFDGYITTNEYRSDGEGCYVGDKKIIVRNDFNSRAITVFEGGLGANDRTFYVTGNGTGWFKGGLETDGAIKPNGYHSVGYQKEAIVVGNTMAASQPVDLKNGNLFYWGTGAGEQFCPYFDYSPSTFGQFLAVGESISVILMYYTSAVTYPHNFCYIDGVLQSVYWMGGTVPAEGGTSGVDIATYQISRVDAGNYLVIASHNLTSG